MTDLDEAIRQPRTRDETVDYLDYVRLRTIRVSKPLSKSEAKRYLRVRTRLVKTGVIRPVTQERLRKVAMESYRQLPWYKRMRMRAKFRWVLFKEWLKTIR
jgi:hypothetical protein